MAITAYPNKAIKILKITFSRNSHKASFQRNTFKIVYFYCLQKRKQSSYLCTPKQTEWASLNACRKKKASYLCIPFQKEALKVLKKENAKRKKKNKIFDFACRLKTSSYLCTPLEKQALQGHGKSSRLAPN